MHFFQTKAQIRCIFSNSKGVTSPEVLFNCIISNSVGCRKVVSQNENYYSWYCIRFKRQSSLRCLWGNLFRSQQYGITILLVLGRQISSMPLGSANTSGYSARSFSRISSAGLRAVGARGAGAAPAAICCLPAGAAVVTVGVITTRSISSTCDVLKARSTALMPIK